MPLDPYSMTDQDVDVVGDAISIMRQRCMKRFGFNMKVAIPDASTQAATNRDERARMYGITDPAIAKVYGYGFPPSSLPGPDHSLDGASAAFLFVLSGNRDGTVTLNTGQPLVSPGKVGGQAIPPGGCSLEAVRKVQGTETGLGDLGLQLGVAAGKKAVADPAFTQLKAEWAACMAKSGYHRKSPTDITPSTDGNPAPPAEVQEALTDIACKKSTDYVARFAELHTKYENQQLEANQLALNAEKERIDAVVKRAAAIVSGQDS